MVDNTGNGYNGTIVNMAPTLQDVSNAAIARIINDPELNLTYPVEFTPDPGKPGFPKSHFRLELTAHQDRILAFGASPVLFNFAVCE